MPGWSATKMRLPSVDTAMLVGRVRGTFSATVETAPSNSATLNTAGPGSPVVT